MPTISELLEGRLLSLLMDPIPCMIGMHLLTMPFCFKQCGIVLAIFILIVYNMLSRMAGHFLIKSAILLRTSSFASHVFHQKVKLLVDLIMVGFMMCSCVAYMVVIGDLVPQIISNVTGTSTSEIDRIICIITVGSIFIISEELHQYMNDIFYFYKFIESIYPCIIAEMVVKSIYNIFLEEWWYGVNYWRLDGVSLCLPILFLASCSHVQLYELYYAEIIEPITSESNIINELNRNTFIYIIVGLFGYIRFDNTQSIAGNILVSYEPSILSEMFKVVNICSVVCNFHLEIFKCCNILNSLPYIRETDQPLDVDLSDLRRLYVTIAILTISMIIAILMPNQEFVLSIMGWTIGQITFIFPALIFIFITNRDNRERPLAQSIISFGICIITFHIYTLLKNLYYYGRIYADEMNLYINKKSILPSEINRLWNTTEDLHINPNISNITSSF